MPAISILMPVKNASRWLGEALASIQGQRDRDWELIAVDDGSSDESLAMLESAAVRDRRIRVLGTDGRERGIATVLNRAFGASMSPLVARMDADDLSHPGRLAAQRAFLERHTDVFAVGCLVEAFPATCVRDGMRRYLRWQNSLVAPESIARDRFVETPVLHPTLMMRRKILAGLGGWRTVGWPEDFDLLLRAFDRGLRVGKVAALHYSWRLHSTQASRTDARYSPEAFRRARAHFLARMLAHRGNPAVWILGAGSVGKRLGKTLAAQGAELMGFADIDPRKIGGRVSLEARGGIAWPVVSMDVVFAERGHAVAVAAVGQPGARERIRRWMTSRGWIEGEDFWAAA